MQKISELSEKQDRELLDLLMGGSQKAFGELYARYRERLIYLCKRCLKNEADAEDLFHDVFLKLWDTRHTLGAVSSFSGLVQTMIQNHATDKLRHSDVHSRFARNKLMDETDLTNETEETIINNDYKELLDELIEKLPPMQKKVFTLSRIEGHTYKEIAELLHISVHTVQEHASLAVKKMEKNLGKLTDFLKIIIFFCLHP